MNETLLKRVQREFMEILESIDEGRVHHDGDDFHEILRDIEAALAQPAQAPEIYSRWQETIAGIPVIFESESEANRFMDYHLANAGKPIEQPAQQEPVAWVDPATLHHLKIGLEGVHLVYETEMVNSLPLYDKPQFQNPKQCLERLIRIMGTFDLATGHADTFDELLDSLESELRDVLGHYRAAVKEHLTQEPVGKWLGKEVEWTENPYKFKQGQPFYTTPPQRTWVGLTDEEVKTLRYKIDVTAHWTYDKFHEAIEAKLKEKNNGLL